MGSEQETCSKCGALTSNPQHDCALLVKCDTCPSTWGPWTLGVPCPYCRVGKVVVDAPGLLAELTDEAQKMGFYALPPGARAAYR
jgi:hypothetical protein